MVAHWWTTRTSCTAAMLAFAAGLTLGVSPAATPIKLSGAVAGSVHDPSGTPQMGAVVELYNHHEKLVEKTITNAGGNFLFASLLPDIYSLHVSVANFVPAIKRNIVVQPGMQSVLAVNLATVFSSVELVYSSRNPGTLMSNDWQWVLRSTMTSRPVTRFLPGSGIADPGSDRDSHCDLLRYARLAEVVCR